MRVSDCRSLPENFSQTSRVALAASKAMCFRFCECFGVGHGKDDYGPALPPATPNDPYHHGGRVREPPPPAAKAEGRDHAAAAYDYVTAKPPAAGKVEERDDGAAAAYNYATAKPHAAARNSKVADDSGNRDRRSHQPRPAAGSQGTATGHHLQTAAVTAPPATAMGRY